MLAVLRGAELTDVVAVVVRWFGGTKLGKGGLARAYAEAVKGALEGLPVARELERVRLALALPYDRLGAVKRLLRPPDIVLAGERYGEGVALALECVPEALPALEEALAELGLTAERERS
jgi:putative IMPACT (imprinted ancient) family translation regulator